MRRDMSIGGQGGQGILVASMVLGLATSLYEGCHATQSQLYWPESRGGTNKSDVIISGHPHLLSKGYEARCADPFSRESYNEYTETAGGEALVIFNPDMITRRS